MPIQPIFWVFFVAMVLTPVLPAAVLSQGADTATAVHAIKAAIRSVLDILIQDSGLSVHDRPHYP
jgi:hypothetical protein